MKKKKNKTGAAEIDYSLLVGKDYWFVGPVMVSDGPHGLRKQEKNADFLGGEPSKPAVCYPTASALACSFDRDLLFDVGAALGDECMSEGISVLLGPGVNHKRSPRCGRNFEYFSEDPVLTGELGAAMVNGIQSRGVGACVKHFAVNSREWGRMVCDSVMDDRTLFEIYLRQFEIIVKKAHPMAMMAAYNRVGGVYCTENERLMNVIAREKWGFDGIFISDWGAVSDPVKAALAGLDVEMPGPDKGSAARIARAVSEGKADPVKIAARVGRVNRFIEDCLSRKREVTVDEEEHLALARRAAESSAVLLKNGGSLPLKPTDRVLLVGSFAKKPRYQGTGSSRIIPVSLDSIYDEMKKIYPGLLYADGYPENEKDDGKALREEACELARGVDRVVVVAGLPDPYESEGYDRGSLAMPPSHDALISSLAKTGADVTVVLQCGAPVETPWADEVDAILLTYLSGCRGGAATAALLTGRACPSGRLAESWPYRTEDDPSYNNFDVDLLSVEHPEGIFTGYRYYDAAKVAPRFPFGYGLSYTEFSVESSCEPKDDGAAVVCRVTNTGDRDGAEVLTVWVGMKDSRIPRPLRELKDFSKIYLSPGQSGEARFELGRDAFTYYDVALGDFAVEKGEYQIFVGYSGREPEPVGSVILDGVEPEREEFDLPPMIERRKIEPAGKKPYTHDSPAAALAHTRLGRFILRVADGKIKKHAPYGIKEARSMVHGTPLRALTLAHPRVTRDTVDGVVRSLNGRLFSGFFRALRGLGKKIGKK